ncbi:hypothetical protein [Rossellomorea vietnamensis]|uniref:hypothetical protein n=1 Tax=Rossellomorea vietnamensis TaxID=218284 RepID=UPI000550F2DF|nr:hypothetical protein [Rossellomorea vietnamensis]
MSNTYDKLIEAVELENIFVRSVNSERFPEGDFKGNIQTDIGISQRIEFYTENKFVALANFNVNAFDELETDKRLMEIDCNFILEYTLDTEVLKEVGSEELEKALNIFINRNVPVNAWPYGREFISQMTTRMGLPALIIGTYKYLPSNKIEE